MRAAPLLPLLLLAACHADRSTPTPVDAASVLTAAGVERPRGLDWPKEVAAQPARETFRNVHVLTAVSSERFMAAMQSMGRNIGLKCLECHVREDYSSDQEKTKVRALDDTAAGQVVPIMSWFTQQLGVSCTHCHAEGGRWESDEKRAKSRARQMLLMVGNLAHLYYQGSTPVTCGTCHRGETRPARAPADPAAG
jgi:photosynthetic reaction center cytochrome c subunit